MAKEQTELKDTSFTILIDNFNWNVDSELNMDNPPSDPFFTCNAGTTRISNRLTSCGVGEWVP